LPFNDQKSDMLSWTAQALLQHKNVTDGFFALLAAD
jgi:hypothetical protein